MNRSEQAASAAARSNPAALRHEARITPSMSVPTTAGRPRSSASRPATRPITPTGQSPRTTVAAGSPGSAARTAWASASALRVRSRRTRFAAWSPAASSAASAGSSVSSSRAASSASPTRPAALSRGAMTKATVSRSTPAGDAPARSRIAASPGSGARPQPVEAEPGDRPVLAEDRGDVGDRADRRQLGQRQGPLRTARDAGEEQLGDLERHPAPGQPRVGVGRVGPMRVDDRDRRRAARAAADGGR